jgi:alkanesulfonate monooxygenase SsuD/methylene tetrahydromethanopterin reductase-like flavin-dependent oxidoreductase (luciferase family)
MRALDVYRARFQPSEQLSEPYAMVGVNVFAADTDAEARRLITSLQLQFVSLRRGTPGPLPPPVDNMDELWSPLERRGVEEALAPLFRNRGRNTPPHRLPSADVLAAIGCFHRLNIPDQAAQPV